MHQSWSVKIISVFDLDDWVFRLTEIMSKKLRINQPRETYQGEHPQQKMLNFGSNSEAQESIKSNAFKLNYGKNSPGMSGPIVQGMHGQYQTGFATFDGTVGQVGIEGELGNYRDQLGREHPSVGLNAGVNLLKGSVSAGTPDNNARFGLGLGMSFGFGSTITDVDHDGIPERNIDINVGPFSLGWTTEDICSVISKDRYLELKKQAEREVYEEIGFFGHDASEKLQERLDQLVQEQIQKVTNPKGL